MPAVNKPVAAANTNGRRKSSRMSSPYTRTTTNSPAPVQESQKERRTTMLDGWLEPPTAPPKPSYEDHGGVAYGVLEQMQPLGALPTAKPKARVKPESLRKTALGKAGGARVGDSHDTPESTPGLESDRAPSAPAEEQLAPLPAPPDDERDQDYVPAMKPKKSSKSRTPKMDAPRPASPPKPMLAAQSASPLPPPSTVLRSTATPQQNHRAPAPAPQVWSTQSRTKLQDIISAAVRRARDDGNPALGFAVQDIYNRSIHSQHLTNLLESILSQTATPEQTKEFQDHIAKAKKAMKAKESAARRSQGTGSPATNGEANLKSASPPKSPQTTIPLVVPSIETAPQPSRPKISLRLRTPQKAKVVTDDAPGVSKNVAKQKARSRERSASNSSSLSSLTDVISVDEEADIMDMTFDADGSGDRHEEPSNAAGVPAVAADGKVNATQPPAGQPLTESNLKRSSVEAGLHTGERDRVLAAKKQKLGQHIIRDDAFGQSDMRETVISRRVPSIRINGLQKPSLVPPPIAFQAPSRGNLDRGSRAASLEPGSPLSETFTPTSSRHNTPQGNRRLSKLPRRQAKTKISPAKKNSAVSAALAGAGGGRDSPIGYEDNDGVQSENNDFCNSCLGSGYLLCCDGCDKSYHFYCVDPPLEQDAADLAEPWYCRACLKKSGGLASAQPPRGLFGKLLANLATQDPVTFALPQNLREYYEGVQTSKEGSFAEAGNHKTRGRGAGWDEPPDLLKTRDGKGQVILCNHCGKSALGRREIIQCDFCSIYWHLDCLDPPLANPPARALNGRKLHDWMCPLHVEHDLRKVDAARLHSSRPGTRTMHLRRPKNAKVIDTSLSRGFVNNGIIEIINESSDDEEFYEDDNDSAGRVFRVPEKGLKLDFIDKVKTDVLKRKREMRCTERAAKRQRTDAHAALRARMNSHSFAEQQAAINLAQFAQTNRDLGLGGGRVGTLAAALIAEAPENVVAQLDHAGSAVNGVPSSSTTTATTATEAPPSPPASEQPEQPSAQERAVLLKLQEIIRRRLEGVSKKG
ncbi:hypothetical protein LTR66_009217 [Elasticomyces elasticus]|nr:hypothetical protein LTR66_009217 [Elasticomyces elasticus]